MILQLEPWGDQFEMLPGSSLCLLAKAERPGSFKIEHLESEIIVWAWPSAIVNVSSEGDETVVDEYERPAVPAVPEGHSVRSFLRMVLGKDRTF